MGSSRTVYCLFLMCFVTSSTALLGSLNINEMLLKDYIFWRSIFSLTGNRGQLKSRSLTCVPACDVNADCYVISTSPSNVCRCKEGYTGDGLTCEAIVQPPPTEDPLLVCQRCAVNADCYLISGGGYGCRCKAGFSGNGLRCIARRNEQIFPPTTPISRCATPCGPNALCVRDFDRNYFCACAFGFERDGGLCKPTTVAPQVATCAPSCDINAACGKSRSGIYGCTCNTGYTGDGLQCKKIQQAIPVCVTPCAPTATCVFSPEGAAVCQCMDMYYGDGEFCVAISNECSQPCHSQALCLRSTIGFSQCVCRLGFDGDGIETCSLENPTPPVGGCGPCGENAFCNEGTCQCVAGFVGNGLNCISLTSITDNIPKPSECNPNCHDNADCVKLDDRYVCECKTGYSGDGNACTPVRIRQVTVETSQAASTTTLPPQPQNDRDSKCNRPCHRAARCQWIGGSRFTCVCRKPFVGGGRYCYNPVKNKCRTPCGPMQACMLYFHAYSCVNFF